MHYVNKARPNEGHYCVIEGDQGARWEWTETAKGMKYEDAGHWLGTVAEAYRDAADDWETNGNSANKRLSGQLRAAATRAERK